MSPDFILQLEFAGQLGPDYALSIVSKELEYRRTQRAAEIAEEQWWQWGAPDAPEVDHTWLEYISRLVHDRGWQSTSLLIGWLETTQRSLQAILEREEQLQHAGQVSSTRNGANPRTATEGVNLP